MRSLIGLAFSEKAVDDRDCQLRGIEKKQVAVVEEMKPRTWDQRCKNARIDGWNQRIVLARQHERPLADEG